MKTKPKTVFICFYVKIVRMFMGYSVSALYHDPFMECRPPLAPTHICDPCVYLYIRGGRSVPYHIFLIH